jgi:signal transduction histidine kinase
MVGLSDRRGAAAAGACAACFVLQSGIVFPYFASVSAAWLPVAGAATYQHFTVRRQLRESETDKARYRQAIHFVTHEMRTPLTAIQGSSELMGRYALPEEKRKQMAQMINSESKRLARMIQTFLDVERLTEGQMELKRDSFPTSDDVVSCMERVRPLAERKTDSHPQRRPDPGYFDRRSRTDGIRGL